MGKVKKTILIIEIIIIVVLFLVIGTIINMNYDGIKGSVITEKDIKGIKPNECPASFDVKKIDNNRVKILFKSDNDIYIVDSVYKENDSGIYFFEEGRVLEPLKNNDNMEYMVSNINYRKILIYSGGALCKEYYFVKDNMVLNDTYNTYDFSKYVIVADEGLIYGDKSEIKSNSQVFSIGNPSIKNGYDETGARITFEQQGKIAHINFNIPKEYVSTYLSHPLGIDTKLNDKSLTKTNTKNNSGDYISGIEINANEGDNVYTMDSGKVVNIVEEPNDKGTYGCRIIIKSMVNNKSYYFTYAHLKQNSILVKEGDVVVKGDKIAEVGKTASSSTMLSKPTLYISMTYEDNNMYYPVLLSNFINKKESYSNIDIYSYKKYQKLQ